MPKWHFGSPSIPWTVVCLSIGALSLPPLAYALAGGEPIRFETLVWLPALIPAFLLAYYRGWGGIATGLAMGMVVFSMAQVYLVASGRRAPDWPLMMSITVAFAGIALFLGTVSERLHAEREKAEQLALFDPLTDLPNRRFIDLILEREFAAAQRGRPVVVVAFDLDGLKAINDQYGHRAGDEALKAVAAVLSDNTRTMDLSGRLAGDEFVSILSSASVGGASVFVKRVQEAIEKLDGFAMPLTISAGLAASRETMSGPDELLEAADRALYEAKTAGVGKVVVAPAPAPPEFAEAVG